MFLQLNDDTLVNKYWLFNVYINPADNTQVVYEMVNGGKVYEKFGDSTKASTRLTAVITELTN